MEDERARKVPSSDSHHNVDVTTNSTVMLSFLHWVIPQYIVLAPTTVCIYILEEYNLKIMFSTMLATELVFARGGGGPGTSR